MIDPFVWISRILLSEYVVICPIPIVLGLFGRSTFPLMITLEFAGSLENPVMTHLLLFCTIQPIYPEVPDCDINAELSSTELRQCGCTLVIDDGKPI